MPPRRILIVDDQREVSRLLRSALVTLEQDLEIVEMPSGEEAILDATRSRVDLLVADYRLPGISGLQLMKKIRSYHPYAKVILITGMVDPNVRKEVARSGADAFFIKPISIAEFLDSVERVLDLVETILPLEPILTEDDKDNRQGLADQFSELRKKIKAQAVLLINDRGKILACAGELPEKSDEISLVTSLMAIYSADLKITRYIGHETNSNWHIFTGSKLDLIFCPLDSTYAILLAGKNIADEDVILQNIRHFTTARQSIEASLIELEDPIIPYIKERPGETQLENGVEIPEEDLAPLLKRSKAKVGTDELDAFWSDATEGQPAAPFHADGLSYDQARKLGLTPEDGQV